MRSRATTAAAAAVAAVWRGADVIINAGDRNAHLNGSVSTCAASSVFAGVSSDRVVSISDRRTADHKWHSQVRIVWCCFLVQHDNRRLI